ncbi:MAG: hypothetical protein ABI634_01985 [Acidobacteriota bacterium]
MTVNDDVDVGEYCRRVEEHLSRVNQGHLVRIVGSGFELVRQWAMDGVPFSVVCRAIDMKAERHRAGRSTRPLRIEFCESDVRAVFQDWKRAVGVTGSARPAEEERADDAKPPSLSKHLDRVVAALTRAAGRLEVPASFRDELTRILEGVVELRESTRGRRGAGREGVSASLARWDGELVGAARASVGPGALAAMRQEAAGELHAYRTRMPLDVWERSLDVATDRLVRERLNLPTIEL